MFIKVLCKNWYFLTFPRDQTGAKEVRSIRTLKQKQIQAMLLLCL